MSDVGRSAQSQSAYYQFRHAKTDNRLGRAARHPRERNRRQTQNKKKHEVKSDATRRDANLTCAAPSSPSSPRRPRRAVLAATPSPPSSLHDGREPSTSSPLAAARRWQLRRATTTMTTTTKPSVVAAASPRCCRRAVIAAPSSPFRRCRAVFAAPSSPRRCRNRPRSTTAAM